MTEPEGGISELEEHRIRSLPQSLYYVPQFLSPEEERSLLDKVAIFYSLSFADKIDPRQALDGIIASTTPVTSIASSQRANTPSSSLGGMATKALYGENGSTQDMAGFTSLNSKPLLDKPVRLRRAPF